MVARLPTKQRWVVCAYYDQDEGGGCTLCRSLFVLRSYSFTSKLISRRPALMSIRNVTSDSPQASLT